MLGDQLNFRHIFDETSKHHKEEPEKLDSLDSLEPLKPLEQPAPIELSEINEKKLILDAAPISINEQQLDQKIEYLLSLAEPSVADFEPILPEIMAYKERLRNLKIEYTNCDDKTKKEELYWILVSPDFYDEPFYRSMANLYLKYQKALENQKVNSLKEAKKKIIDKTEKPKWRPKVIYRDQAAGSDKEQ